ncbi:hypothetical protein FEM48_Zijuj01G0145900 [Ziziphus jujuba var. spinosa]|uniref:Vacuolar protein sorting-associated protein 28 homolog n=2 Tax=Ziziphus jujuba TaxID=326968 RepID=A0A978W1U1_ZIZJJ|nr:hypothetical protein FEM48_Zijuj01G0145900 [Ziziphus jujuba var. spinosa]
MLVNWSELSNSPSLATRKAAVEHMSRPSTISLLTYSTALSAASFLRSSLVRAGADDSFEVSKYNTQMEVKLWNDKREREMYDNFAELYAIIKATEKLEKAYIRDIISSSEYEAECLKLIAHFKTLASTLKDTIPSIERFADTYKMDCPAALNRLITSGVPATVEHRAAAAASANTSAAAVAECTQHFITAMDTLKLNMVAVDQVHPALSALAASLNKVTFLPPDFLGKVKLREWIGKLLKMGAADELSALEARQLVYDLEASYDLFMAALPNAGT